MTLAQAITRIADRLYLPFIRRFIDRRTFVYGLCGGFNVLVLAQVLYYAAFHYVVCERFTDLGFVVVSPHVAALIIIFPVVNFAGFWLNKHVTFRGSTVRTRAQVVRYAMSIAMALILNYLCLKLFVEVLHIYPTPSQFLSSCVCAVSSYLMQRYYTFRIKN